MNDHLPPQLTLAVKQGVTGHASPIAVSLWTTSRKRELIAALALRYRLLTVNLVRIYVENGLLASYGPDFTEMYRRGGVLCRSHLAG